MIAAVLTCALLPACGGPARSDRAATTGRDSLPESAATVMPGADQAHDTATPGTSRTPTLADTLDPAVTVRAYLERARVHRAARDTMIWEPATDGTSGYRSFDDTTISAFATGVPGGIEGAAGSRYVTIPFTVATAGGATVQGTATLRRAVVDGASETQRRWRIVRIEWSAPR